MVKIFSVDGNIGSGKSTLLKYFEKNNKNSSIIFLPEPVHLWEKIQSVEDGRNQNIIEKFYENPDKYAFSFQIMALISRIKLLKETIDQATASKLIIITERSPFTDKEIFAKMLFHAKKIEDINYLIYLEWFDFFMKEFPLSGVIYVNTPYSNCYENILKRNRQGEKTISIDYLKKCERYHEEYLSTLNDIKLIYIEGGFEQNNKKIYEILNNFIFN